MKAKRRLLALLLSLLLCIAAFPLSLLPASAADRATAADYNDLYVQSGLVYQLDFFCLNPIWDPDGTALAAAEEALSGTSINNYNGKSWFVTYRSVGTIDFYSSGSGPNFTLKAGHITLDNTDGSAGYMGSATTGWSAAYPDLGMEVVFQPNSTAGKVNGSGVIYRSPFRIQDVYLGCTTADNVFTLTTVREAASGQSFSGVTLPADRVGTLSYYATQDETDATAFTYGAATNGASYSTITGTDAELAATAYIGNAYTSNMDLYALRFYSRALTDSERAQNHFADLAKYYALDLTAYDSLAAEDRATVHAALASCLIVSGDTILTEKAAAQAALDAAVKALGYNAPAGASESVTAIYALAKSCDFDLTDYRGFLNEASSLPASFFAQTLLLSPLDSSVSPEEKAAFAVTLKAALDADIFGGNALTAADYNALYAQSGLVYQLDFYTLNSIWDPDGTALAAAEEALSGTSVNNYNGKSWFVTYRSVGTIDFYSSGSGPSFDLKAGHISLINNDSTDRYMAAATTGWSAAYPDLGMEVVFQPNSTAGKVNGSGVIYRSPFRIQDVYLGCTNEGGLFSLTTVREAASGQSFSGVTLPTDQVGTLSYYATQDETDAAAFTYGAATNGAAYSTVTGTDAELAATAYIGNAYTSNMDLYALRFYDHALTDAERAQNHFADVAKYFRLNLMVKSFEGFSDAQMADIYASVADITLDSTRGEAQMAYYQVLSAMPYELISAVFFDGYAVRLSSNIPGIRAVFNFDMDAVCAYAQKYGVSVELGVSVSGSSTVEKIAVTVNADGSVASDSLYYEPESADGYSSFVLALLYREGTDGTPIAEMNPTDRKAMLNAEVTYRGFVKVTKAGETPTVYSLDMTSSFGDAVSAAEVYTRFATESDVAEDSLVRQVADWLN